jgi:hypothetical protein
MNLGPATIATTYPFVLNQSGGSITLGDGTFPPNWTGNYLVSATNVNQDISGVKNFYSTPTVNSVSISTATDTNAVSANLNSTGISLLNTISSTGSTLSTRLNSTGQTLTNNLNSTGATLNNTISSLSGTLTSVYATAANLNTTGNALNGYITTTNTNLATTGNTLKTYIDVNSVKNTGNQTISGIKTFANTITVTGVGIGMTSANRLDIAGVYDPSNSPSIYVYPSTYLTSKRAAIRLDNWQIGQDSLANGTKDLFISGGTVSDFKFNITTGGNIGINIQSPSSKLHIKGSGDSYTDGILLEQAGTYPKKYSVSSRESGKFSISDETLTTERFTISSGGNVGIGIQSPFYKLHISGAGAIALSGAPITDYPSTPLYIAASGNTYVQTNFQNKSTGNVSSMDIVITRNDGTDITGYLDIGINNSGYSDPDYNMGSGYDGYFYINGGSLAIGTQTPNKNINFHVGGTTLSNKVAEITSSGLNVSGRLYQSGVPIQNFFTVRMGHSTLGSGSVTGYPAVNYFGMVSMAVTSVQARTGVKSSIAISEPCVIKRVSWTHSQGTTGNLGYVDNTGVVINLTNKTSGIIPLTWSKSFTNPLFAGSSGDPVYITGFLSTPVNVNAGDNIVCGFQVPSGYNVTPTRQFPNNIDNQVDLYCYTL